MAMGVSLLAVPKIGNAYLSVATSTLKAYWALDETSGVRYDSAGANDLTDNNTVSYATGVISNGADFDSNNSEYLSIADASTDVQFTDNWSLNIWVHPETLANKGIFAKSDGSYNGIQCYYNTTWIQCFADPGNTDTDINFNTVTWSVGSWQMMTFVYNSDTIKLYRNGALEQTVDLTNGTLTNTSVSFLLGTYSSTAIYGDGEFDEVSYFSDDLTADDVAFLYNSGAGVGYADLFEPVSTSSTSTATTTTTSADVSELKWVIELYLAIFMFLVFTWLGYRFTKFFL